METPPPVIAARQQLYAEVAKGKLTVLQTAQFVYVRRSPASRAFSPAYSGPYRILSKQGKVCELQMGDRREMVSEDCHKPHTCTPTEAATPPQLGSPPGTSGKR